MDALEHTPRPILAIDIARQTGWAAYPNRHAPRHVTSNGLHLSGTETLPWHPDQTLGFQLWKFEEWLEEKDFDFRPEMIVYEKAHLRGRNSFLLAGCGAIVELFASKKRMYCESVHTGTLKKWATGYGKATKEDMIKACMDRIGIIPEDDNECDALWLYYYATTNLWQD